MKALLPATTESVCPVGLRRIAAQRVAEGDAVHLVKHCAEHGDFKTVVWRGLESYQRFMARGSRAQTPPVSETSVARGCPHDCGLCPEHEQHSCCVLLEVTARCNLKCPVCFAGAGVDCTPADDPSLATIDGWLERLRAHGSAVNIQLSGGEPTLRDDLPEIIRRVRARGFGFVQVNSNGLRLAKEAGYAAQLAQAGLDCVFLQFDGVSEASYQHIRGARLMQLKERAIARCGEAGLGVVLVPTLVPGINVGEIGAIVDFALARVPTVRAVHFQPISYFGRHPLAAGAPDDAQRITLPEVIAEIERQSGGRLRADNFGPGSAEHALCSFIGNFTVDAAGALRPVRSATACCSGEEKPACSCGTPARDDEAPRSRRIVAHKWASRAHQDAVSIGDTTADPASVDVASFDAFLAARGRPFSISGMAFQDAWTLDLERLRQCFIHVVSPDRRVVPFCAYNLSAVDGSTLYRAATVPETSDSSAGENKQT